MKNLLLPLLLTIGACASKAPQVDVEKSLTSLTEQQKVMQTLIERAIKCVPRPIEAGHELCNGVVIDPKGMSELRKLTVTERSKRLRRLQLAPELKNDLAFTQRRVREQAFVTSLNQNIAVIEDLERQKKQDEAIALGKKVAPFVDYLSVWRSLNEWFEAKNEAYLVYHFCEEIACTPTEKEDALTQLYHRRVFLPLYVRAEVEKAASVLVRGKEKAALKNVKATWRKLTVTDTKVAELLKLDWPGLLSVFRKRDIAIFRVAEPAKVQILEGHTLPMEMFEKLPVIPQGLTDEQSKVLRGEAFAKYVPYNGASSIVVTSITTKASLVHEYLHHLQAKANPSYGRSLEWSGDLKTKFQQKKLTKDQYEAAVSEANAYVWISEHEAYEKMMRFADEMAPLEKLNTKEIYLRYKKLIEAE